MLILCIKIHKTFFHKEACFYFMGQVQVLPADGKAQALPEGAFWVHSGKTHD
jgi:hypothetical protein